MGNFLYNVFIFPVYSFIEVFFDYIFIYSSYNILLSIFAISFVSSLFLSIFENAKPENNKNLFIKSGLKICVFFAALFMFKDQQATQQIGFQLSEEYLSLLKIFAFFPILFTFFKLNKFDYSKKNKIFNIVCEIILIPFMLIKPPMLTVFWTIVSCFDYLRNLNDKSSSPRKNHIKTAAFSLLIILFPIITSALSFSFVLQRNKSILLIFLFLGFCFLFFKLFDKFSFKEKDVPLDVFALSSALLCVFGGIYITSTIVAASPSEFSFLGEFKSPLSIIFNTFSQFLGFFVLYPMLLYFNSNKKYKNVLTFFAVLFFIIGFIGFNSMIALSDFVSLSVGLHLNISELNCLKLVPSIINLILVVLAVCAVFALFQKNKFDFLKQFLTFALVIISVISLSNLFNIGVQYAKLAKFHEKNNLSFKNSVTSSTEKFNEKLINLSKNGKNVLIIFIDRAISSYLPMIFEEYPELSDIYSGFVFYPNTVSFYGHTLLAYPPMIAGYEYIPDRLNARTSEKMLDKYNEALLVLPLIFKNNGYVSTVIEPPFENFEWAINDGKIFEAKGIKHFIVPVSDDITFDKSVEINSFKRNFFYFNIFTSVPSFLKKMVYKNGAYKKLYHDAKETVFDKYLLREYEKLSDLSEMTSISDDYKNTFTVFNNGILHINNYFDGFCAVHYKLEKDAFFLIGNYLNFLKEKGVYDNTRIIIVSDHGHWKQANNQINIKYTSFNPLLMVKDFNSNAEFKHDKAFMTNADATIFAVKNIIKNPVNPFSGKNIISFVNKDNIRIYIDNRSTPDSYKGTGCLQKGDNYYEVHSDISDDKNWSSGKL